MTNAAATFELPLVSVDRVGADVLVLKLDGAANPMPYREGQFLALELPDRDVRAYSLAQPCSPDGQLELHVRLRPDGMMARWLENGLAPGNPLRLRGPYGDLVWQPVRDDEPVVMLATGTGIAPLHAMLMRELANYGSAPITLYWGGRGSGDLYLMEHFERLARIARRFAFVPVLSRPEAGWSGARGHVQQIAAQRHPDLRNGRVYACGAPAMVRDARDFLHSRCGLPHSRFMADAFEPAAAAAAPAPADAATVRIIAQLHDGRREGLTAAAGGSLYAALKAADLIQGVCGGNLSCGTCRVRPDAGWSMRLPAIGKGEQRLLGALDEAQDGDRLACQVTVTAELSGLPLRLYAPAW